MTSQPKEEAKYRVILSGRVMPECDHQQVVEGMASLFHSQASTMENLLKGVPTPLKKSYDKAQAQTICANIRKAGAQCTIEEISVGETSAEVHDNIVPESGTSHKTSIESSAESSEGAYCGQSNKGKRQPLLMRFVNHNTDYYQPQFNKFVIADESGADQKNTWSAFKITWHWPAFFGFFFWALYRKMWFWATVHVLGGAGLMLWVSSSVVSLMWMFIWPLTANFLYFQAATTAVNRAMKNPKTEQHFLDKGGVSKGAVCGGIIIVLISTMLISNYVTSRFLAQYGEQISDVLPGSGSQTRGTGLPLEYVVDESKLARTSLILSTLATMLKIFLIKNNENNEQSPSPMQSVISTFIDHLNNGQISDGWGGKIRVEQHLNRHVLISAGPDQVFKTDDDVLQPVMTY